MSKAVAIKSKAATPDKQPAIQYKSNFKAVIEMITSLQLTKLYIEALQNYCPFWSLIDSIRRQELTIVGSEKSDLKLYEIIQTWDPMTKAFIFGGRLMPVTYTHIKKIFGIHDGTDNVIILPECKNKKEYIPFVRKWFEKDADNVMIRTNLAAAINALMKRKKPADANDLVRLLTLFLLNTLFVPNSCSSIGWGYLELVYGDGDIKTLKQYDWTEHILDRLIESLNCNRANKVFGCVMAIPYILLETFNLQFPNSTKFYSATVWATKWRLKELTKAWGNFTLLAFLKSCNIDLTATALDQSVIMIESSTQEIKKRKRLGPKPKKMAEVDKKLAIEIDKEVDDTEAMIKELGMDKTLRELRSTKRMKRNSKRPVSPVTPKVTQKVCRDELEDTLAETMLDLKKQCKDIRESQSDEELEMAGLRTPVTTYCSDTESDPEIKKQKKKIKKAEPEKQYETEIARLQNNLQEVSQELEIFKQLAKEAEDGKETIDKVDEVIRLQRELEQETVRASDANTKANLEIWKLKEEINEKTRQLDSQKKTNIRLLAEKKQQENEVHKLQKDIEEGQQKTAVANLSKKQRLVLTEKFKEVDRLKSDLQQKDEELVKVKRERVENLTKFKKDIEQMKREMLKNAREGDSQLVNGKIQAEQEVERLKTEIIKIKKEAAEKMQNKIKFIREQFEIERDGKERMIQDLEKERDHYKECVEGMENDYKKLQETLEYLTEHNKVQLEKVNEELFNAYAEGATHDATQKYRLSKEFEENSERTCEELRSIIARIKNREGRKTKVPYTPTKLAYPTIDKSPELEIEHEFKTPRIGDAVTRFDEPRSPAGVKTQQEEEEDKKPKNQAKKQVKKKMIAKRKITPRGAKKIVEEEKENNEQAMVLVQESNAERLFREQEEYLAKMSKEGKLVGGDDGFPELSETIVLTDVEGTYEKEKAHKIIKYQNSTEVTKLMDVTLFDKLKEIHEEHGPWVALLYKPGRSTSNYHFGLNDVYKIIDGEELCNSVINGYAYMVEQKYNTKENHDFKIFDSLCWTYIRDPIFKDALEKKVDKPLAKHRQKPYKMLLFPINSNRNQDIKIRPNHWTLLVFFTEEKIWRFYNSNLARGQEKRNDPYVLDAQLVAHYVEKKLKDADSQPSFELDPELEYEFERMTNVPYQGPTVDCGLYVIFFINSIIQNIMLEKQTPRQFIVEFKIFLIALVISNFERHQHEQELARLEQNEKQSTAEIETTAATERIAGIETTIAIETAFEKETTPLSVENTPSAP